MSSKRKKSKSKPMRRKRPGPVANQINAGRAFQKASDAFHEGGDADEARRLLEQIESQGPMSDDVMRLYLDVLQQQRDSDHYARIATMWGERCPKDPNAVMLSASGALSAGQPVSAILAFERFLELAPEHPAATIARKELVKLKKILPKLLDAFEDSLPKTLPRIASIEKVLHGLKLGRFQDVVRRCEIYLQTYPDDLRIRNNLAESLAQCGRPAEAISTLDDSIRQAPDNFYARAARCRILYLQAKFAESDADAEALLTLEPKQLSDLTRAAQAFAYRGDDERIDWAYRNAHSRGWLAERSPEVAVLLHLKAAYEAYADEPKAARKIWKRAEAMAPGATLAGDNLADLRELTGDRWGPFYFDIRHWFDQSQQEMLKSLVGLESPDADEDDTLDRVLLNFMKANPPFEALLSGLLYRGDSHCQRLAIAIAKQSRKPETKRMLLDYAQSSRGTDGFRQLLASELSRRGELPTPIISMHVRGNLDQLEFIRFRITDEPSVPEGRTDATCELISEGLEMLHTGQPAVAERLFREALQQEPEAPDVLNNLAASLERQDRRDEADRLVDDVIEKYPDYFFGRMATANRLIPKKKYDQALEILVELQRREELHETEFAALAISMIHVHVGKREFASAERWLGMFADYLPDNPNVEKLAEYLARRRSLRKWSVNLFAV